MNQILGEIRTTKDENNREARVVVYANSRRATKSIMVMDHQGDAWITLTDAQVQQLISLMTQV